MCDSKFWAPQLTYNFFSVIFHTNYLFNLFTYYRRTKQQLKMQFAN